MARRTHTERRRAQLRFSLDSLERMEDRSMITESLGMLSFVIGTPAAAASLFAQRDTATVRAAVKRPTVDKHASVLPITAARALHAGHGSSSASHRAATAVPTHTPTSSRDWLTLHRPHHTQQSAQGLSRFHRGGLSNNQGGGAAMSRGGIGAMRPGTITPIRFSALFGADTATGSGVVSSDPTRTTAAPNPHPSSPTTSAPTLVPASPSTPAVSGTPISATPPSTTATSSPELSGSLPVPVRAAVTAPFTVDTIDYNRGVVLLDGSTSLGTNNGNEDLRAQVRDTTVSTYSWDTTHLTHAMSITGTSTYRLQFQWHNSLLPSQTVTDSVTLTITNNSSQQVTQTYTFVVPPASGSASAPTWPETLSPDLLLASAPVVPTHNATVDANDGALDTMISLPTYNPNISPLVLAYDSQAAAPQPLILEHHTLDPSLAIPTKVSAQLTFNGTAGSTYYYNTSQFIPGDIEQIPLFVDASALSTGRYSYSISVTDYRSSNTTTTPSGTATIDNESGSAFGAGWTLQGLEQIYTATGGVILTLGSGDRSLWFATSGGSYTTPAGDFSTLAAVSGGGYTRTMPDGMVYNFNSNGQETSVVDRNGLRITFAYDSGGKLQTVTDPYTKITTFAYDSGGKLSTITDPASRIATFTHSGNNLTGLTLPDSSTWSYAYDGSGRATRVTDPRSKTVTITYDSIGRVSGTTQPDGSAQAFTPCQKQGYDTTGTSGSPAPALLLAEAQASYTDPLNNTFTMRPDWRGMGLLNQATDQSGNTATYNRTVNGLATVTIDRLARISQDAYDSSGNVTQHTYPDGNTEKYTYNSFAEPLTHTDPNNHTTTYTYDGQGNLTVVKDALNNLTTMTYTGNGRLATMKDPRSNTTSFAYDSQDRLTTVTYPGSATKLLAYDSEGNPTTITDERGNATVLSFDVMNRKIKRTDALGDVATFIYDSSGNLTADQEPLSRTTTYTYDSMNRIVTVTDPLSHSSVASYDSGGNLVSTTDPLGRITTHAYDVQNRPTVVTDPLGNRTTTTYDAEGQILTVKDPLLRVTTYTYNSRGWMATKVDPLSNTTTYSYTGTGKPATVTNPAFGTALVVYTYDANDRQVKVADSLGRTTTTVYDSGGNVTSVYDPNNNQTQYAYDSRNRLTTVTNPLGHTTVYGYDASGNKTSVTDALSDTTTYGYDALNRVTTITDARSSVTTLAYDSGGRQTVVVDPNGNRTTYSYDARDRVTTLTDALGTSTFSYDADNELTEGTDHNGRRTTFAYDSGGRQINERWLDSSGGTVRTITYTYDAVGELTGAIDPDATLTFTYDSGGRQITAATSSAAGQPNVTLTAGYDAYGNRTSLTDNLASVGRTTFAYDSSNRLTTITQSSGGTAGPQVVFGYDSGGRLTTENRTIGGSGTAVNSTIAYDAANRITTIQHAKVVANFFPPGTFTVTPLATFVYGYDNANRLTSETNAEGSVTFTYDNANELTGVSGARSESYGYDSGGNRNTNGYTTGSGNEQTATPGYTFTYDAEGNTTGQTNTSTHATTTFAYDYRNRLTEVTVRASGGGITSQSTFTYDALGRRIGMNINSTQTWTVCDGPNTYADFSTGGTLQKRYVYGPAVDEILARTDSGGNTAWYLIDKLGSVRDIINSAGTAIYHTGYDSFGNPINQSGTGGDRFMFTGRELDTATGIYYSRNRSYEPSAGRFLQRDPIGFRGGDYNVYSYVHNNVLNCVDPFGTLGSENQGPSGVTTGIPWPLGLGYNDNPAPGLSVEVACPSPNTVAIYDGQDNHGVRVAGGAEFKEAADDYGNHINIKNWADTVEKLKKFVQKNGLIDCLYIFDHGSEDSDGKRYQEIGTDYLTPAMAAELAPLLADDAIITLGGCLVGNNSAVCTGIADATGATVIASPTRVIYGDRWIWMLDYWAEGWWEVFHPTKPKPTDN